MTRHLDVQARRLDVETAKRLQRGVECHDLGEAGDFVSSIRFALTDGFVKVRIEDDEALGAHADLALPHFAKDALNGVGVFLKL